MELISILLVGGLLLLPLTYGISTLDGLRHKRIYPLIRMKTQLGGISSACIDAERA